MKLNELLKVISSDEMDYFYVDDKEGNSLYADELGDGGKKRDMRYLKKYVNAQVVRVSPSGDNSLTVRIDYTEVR